MLLAALVASPVAALPALAQSMREDPRDIPYFERHHAEREAVLKQCQRYVRIARSPICINAERAGAGQLGRPWQPLPPEWRQYPYAPSPPQQRGTARGT